MFERTVKAFLAEEGSLWQVVDALVEEMPGHCSGEDLTGCQRSLAAAGIDKSTATIADYRVVGQFVERSTPSQSAAFRSQSVTTITVFAQRGASQEMALAELRKFQKTTGRQRMPRAAARSLFESGRARPAGPSAPSFDERCAAWVQQANKLMMDGARLAEEADGAVVLSGHAELALTIYKRMTERQLDAEIRQLLETEDVR